MDLSSRDVIDNQPKNLNSIDTNKANNLPSLNQTSRLEEIFTRLKYPNESQTSKIAKELGLEPKQANVWFQNKRTQNKYQNEKAVNYALHVENERLRNENIQMKEELKNMFSKSCGGAYCKNHDDHEKSMQQLHLEIARLKEEHEKLSNYVAMHTKKQKSSLELLELKLGPPTRTPYDQQLRDSMKLRVGSSSKIPVVLDENVLVKPICKRTEMEKAMMMEVAINAKEELLTLLRTNDPLWKRSPIDHILVLHHKNYEDVYPRVDHFNGAKTHIESSKNSQSIQFGASHLAKLLLHSENWTDIFANMVTKSQTIEVLESGCLESRSRVLQLVYEERHVLSPFVPSREFYFLRYFEQLEADVWVITNVSYDYLKEDGPHSSTWMFPSGCMIHKISNCSSEISWVEHVEVDDKIKTHPLYIDLVKQTTAFGADRWLMDLQRMIEKVALIQHISIHDRGVVTSLNGKQSVMHLSIRMIKDFCRILSISSKTSFRQSFTDVNDGKIRLAIRKIGGIYQQNNNNVIVIAATSVLFPFSSQMVFDFLRDPARRFQWDSICLKNSWHEIAHIPTGANPNSYISIIQPMEPSSPNGMAIIQDFFTNHLGSYIVFSPVNCSELNMAIKGKDPSAMSLIPSGFVISDNSPTLFNAGRMSDTKKINRSSKIAGGSLLTLGFQLVMFESEEVNLDGVDDAVNTLMTSIINNIKNALINLI